MRFAGGTTYLRKKGIAFLLPIICAGAPNPLPSVLQPLYSMESLLVWSNHLVVSYVLEMNVGRLFKYQNKSSDTDRYKGFFCTRYVSEIDVYTMKSVFDQRSKL